MKFIIEKGVLLESLSNVTKAISSRNIIPILNGIMLELKEEGLYLTASDGELTIRSFIEVKRITKVEQMGTIIIQSKYIIDIIRKMPNDLIHFEVIDGLKMMISTDNNQYHLNCLDSKEYPQIKIEEHKLPIHISSSVFKTIISQTSFAISSQELRPLLTGINLKISGDILECVATDSYRLAKKTLKLKEIVKDEINIVVPGKNLIELDKILKEDDGEIEIHVFNNKILFKFENTLFLSNLLSGTYPNTSNLIPTEFDIIVQSKNNNFSDAVDRAALLTQSKDKNIIKIELEKGIMKIKSFSSEIGKVEETVDVETDDKNNIDISFSAKYMLDALKTIKDDDILILLNSDVKPIVIKAVSDESLIQLILPIKTY